MTTPELPALPHPDWACDYSHDSQVYNVADIDAAVEARERILMARIAELQAVLARFDERWLLDGELGFCVACAADAGEDHKPECWLTEANAARGAK